MADPVDEANDLVERWQESVIADNRGEIDPGWPGECQECGEHTKRLIKGRCAPCREELGLG